MSLAVQRRAADDLPGGGAVHMTATPAAKLGLWLFMGVVTVLFSLLSSAYLMRMAFADWRSLPAVPWQLWLSTTMLVMSSVAFQGAAIAARRGFKGGLQIGLLAAGIFALAFLAAQLWAWQQLSALNYLVAGNPANSFFYLITGLHGLHLVGGLAAWCKTSVKVWRGAALERVRLSVELCALYWHFLLALWLALFGLLFFVTPEIIQIICNGF